MSELRLEDRFPNLQPIDSAPSLSTINGIGTCLYGRRDEDAETETYVSTLCFCLLFVPLLCLRSYRIADAGGGSYYFLGREPMSALAKVWNVLMLFATLVGVSFAGVGAWYCSPDGIAMRQLRQADQLAAAGKIGQAADICQRVVLANVAREEEAKQRLVDWLAKPPASAPAKEKFELWRAAQRLFDAGQWPQDQASLAKRALELADQVVNEDPSAALDLVESAWPLLAEPAVQGALVRPTLERAAKKIPGDLRLTVQLAITYDAEQNEAECERLLAPLMEKLGSTEGARILGQIRARQGNFAEAHSLLSPYCQQRLATFKAAEQAWVNELTRIQETALAELQEGKADKSFYEEYNRASQARQDDLVNQFISQRIKDTRGVSVLREEFSRAAAVVPVALDFGMVQLQRGQGMADPAARKSELENAEKTFLAIQNAASDSPEFQLSMAKVNYWLGKQEEGKKILTDVLAAPGAAFDLKLSVANVMRELGLESDSKQLLESLYETGPTPADRANAALCRALLCDKIDEEIVWLERSPESDQRRASLARARGVKHMQEGNDAEAEKELRQAAEAYAAMPANTSSLNNGAICWWSLFGVSGQRSDLDEATARFGKAVALQPDDSVLVVNAATVYFKRAISGIVDGQIDLRLLNAGDDLELLRYLYRDEAGHRQIVARLKSSQELAQAMRYYERGALLAPKRAEIYDWFADLYDFCDEKENLQRLKQRIEEARPDTSNKLREMLLAYKGKNDQEIIKQLGDATTVYRKLRDKIAALPAGEKRNFSLAVCNCKLVEMVIGQQSYGQKVNLEEAVKQAEEAVALAPSSATDSTLAAILASRAHQTLAKKDAGYRRYAESCRRTLAPSVAAFLALEDPALRKAVLADADFRRAADLRLASAERFPASLGSWTWMECRYTNPEKAESLRARAAANDQERLLADIQHALTPADIHTAAMRAAIHRCRGEESQAQATWKELRALGITIPTPVTGAVAGK